MMTHEDWHKKIEATLRWRQEYWNGDKAWRRYLALYRGDHWRTSRYNSGFLEPDSDQPRDKITVNLTGSTILLAKSFLIKNNPKFIIKPRPALSDIDVQRAIVSAQLQQETLNYEWKERGMQFQNKEAALDALIIGHGITKDGFTAKRPTSRKPKKDGDLEPKEYIQDETPYVERINPFRFLFDVENESFRQLDNVSWVAEIFFRTLKDIVADDSYNKDVIKSINADFESPETVRYLLGGKDETVNGVDELCVCYEIWDKRHRKYYVFVKGVVKPVVEKEWPYDYLDGFPYTKLDFIPIPNEHYGLGIPAWIEDQQLELNRVRTTMFDHRRRFNRKYIIEPNAFEPTELEKMRTGGTGTLITGRISGVAPMPEGKIPSDAFAVESTIKGDIQELTGVDQLARGGNLPSRTSAAEINARQSYVNLKLDDRVEDVDAFIKANGRKVLQHIKENYTADRVIQISGPNGQYWVKFSPSDIKAEFDIEMETVSAPKIDEVADRQQRLQIFQMVMQNLQVLMQSGVNINMPELFKWTLEKFGEKDISRFFAGANTIVPDQNAQQGNQVSTQMQSQQPNVMDASQLRERLAGNLSGGQGMQIQGVQ